MNPEIQKLFITVGPKRPMPDKGFTARNLELTFEVAVPAGEGVDVSRVEEWAWQFQADLDRRLVRQFMLLEGTDEPGMSQMDSHMPMPPSNVVPVPAPPTPVPQAIPTPVPVALSIPINGSQPAPPVAPAPGVPVQQPVPVPPKSRYRESVMGDHSSR